MTPMAIAIPPRDMMLEVMPKSFMQMKAMRTATGISMMTLRTLRAWRRKSPTIRLTTSASSKSVFSSVFTAAVMRSLRSYAVWMDTPSGRPGEISAIRCLILSMTSFAFSPYLITTIPPTAWPSPFFSSDPRRISPPSCTVAMFFK